MTIASNKSLRRGVDHLAVDKYLSNGFIQFCWKTPKGSKKSVSILAPRLCHRSWHLLVHAMLQDHIYTSALCFSRNHASRWSLCVNKRNRHREQLDLPSIGDRLQRTGICQYKPIGTDEPGASALMNNIYQFGDTYDRALGVCSLIQGNHML